MMMMDLAMMKMVMEKRKMKISLQGYVKLIV